jgi:predicted aspartyl protease
VFTVAFLSMIAFSPAGANAAEAPAGKAGELIARHIAWLGGEDALRSPDALRLEGAISVAGLEGTLTVVARRDGYQRTDYDLKVFQGMEAVTPDDAWEVNPSGQVETMGADKAGTTRRAARQAFSLHLFGEDDAEISARGREERAGGTWDVVRFAYPDGDYLDLFLDPGDGSCPWARKLEDTELSWTRLDDWRVVDGVRYPFRQESTFDIAMQNQTVTWTAVSAAAADPGLFARPAAAADPVTIDDPGGSTPWIPVTLFLDRYIYLPGTLNGTETDIVLDSGAGMTVLDAPTAGKAGLEGEGALPAVGTGGAVEASIVNGVDIRIGSLSLTGLTAAVIDLSDVNRRIGRPLSVILGKEVFHSVIVDVDYPNRRIAFRDPERWTYKGEGGVLALIPAEDGHKQVEMQVEDLPPAVVDLDTGNGSELALFKSYAEENGILENRPLISERSGGGVGGRTLSTITTLRSVTFAGYVLRDVPVMIPQEEKGAFHTKRFAGNVGAGVFSRFRTIFDYPHDRLIVEPGPGWDTEPFRKDRSGIQADLVDDGLDIAFVAPGSPALAAGLKAGDRIVAVNGEPVTGAYWESAYRWQFGAEGERAELDLAGGRRITLVLKTYY